MRVGGLSAVFAFACAVAEPAAAIETTLFGEPGAVDVTLASSLIQGFDNRDFRLNQVPTLANDGYGYLYDRLNVQARRGPFQLGLRLDNAWFFASPDPVAIALELERTRRAARGGAPDPAYFRRKVDEAGVELSNRYIDWAYPAKYSLAYTTRTIELTAGDDYAELGRGFVLSLRKQDELASDTTVRGLRATARLTSGALKLRLTGLAGSANPLRLDEASGRYLGVDGSVTPGFFAVAEAGMPRAVATDFVQDTGDCQTFATCSYAPDSIFAGQIEARAPGLVLSTQASFLRRQDPLTIDVVRAAKNVLTGSQALELPALGSGASLYVEAAVQKLDHAGADANGTWSRGFDPGHALYLAASYGERPLHLALEGKHYRRFFPLLANVSTARAREFALLALSAPPTTEAVDNDTEFENFNTCTSGARLKADAGATERVELFGWFAHYRTWAESSPNEACAIRRELENRVYDLAAGLELTFDEPRARALLRVGARLDESAEDFAAPGSAPSNLYYDEQNARYELGYALGGPYTLELDGAHRRRHQRVGGPAAPWFEGRNLASLGVGPAWAFAFGFEYDTSGLVPPTYFNGEVTYRPTPSTSLGLFVGQRAGALRCVGGICRLFPPFEGARLDVTIRL